VQISTRDDTEIPLFQQRLAHDFHTSVSIVQVLIMPLLSNYTSANTTNASIGN